MAAFITRVNGDRFDVLGGGQVHTSAEETRDLLRNWWGVDNREDLLKTLARLD